MRASQNSNVQRLPRQKCLHNVMHRMFCWLISHSGPKLNRFVSLIKKYPATKFSCLTDNISAANEQASFNSNSLLFRFLLNLNVGMNRTGISPGEKAIELAKHCSTLKGITLVGLHAYDGHIRDVDFEMKKQKCDEHIAAVQTLNEKLKLPTNFYGRLTSFSVHCKRKDIDVARYICLLG